MNKDEIICFRFTADELEKIDERMKECGIRNRSAFIRKMVLDGYCIHLDLKDIKEMVSLLQRCGNNLNQYAKRANAEGSIYEEDIRDLQEQFAVITKTSKGILEALSTVR
jgi:metal-responsive CopG/Arc/MetJ family transcriptional regulator